MWKMFYRLLKRIWQNFCRSGQQKINAAAIKMINWYDRSNGYVQFNFCNIMNYSKSTRENKKRNPSSDLFVMMQPHFMSSFHKNYHFINFPIFHHSPSCFSYNWNEFFLFPPHMMKECGYCYQNYKWIFMNAFVWNCFFGFLKGYLCYKFPELLFSLYSISSNVFKIFTGNIFLFIYFAK